MNNKINLIEKDRSFLLALKINRTPLNTLQINKICSIAKLKSNSIIASGMYKPISRIGINKIVSEGE
jgi:hypothetical protein